MKYKIAGAIAAAAMGWSLWAAVVPGDDGTGLPGTDLLIDVPAGADSVAQAVADLKAPGFAEAIGAPRGELTAYGVDLRRNPDGFSWLVRGDSELAVELDVTFEPLRGGGTRVRTRIVPGQLTGPALELARRMRLRSAFADAIEAELDPLLPPDRRLTPGEVRARKQAASEAVATVQAAASSWSAGAAGHAIVQEDERLRREQSASGPPVDSAAALNGAAEARPTSEISFEPGQPMVDVGR